MYKSQKSRTDGIRIMQELIISIICNYERFGQIIQMHLVLSGKRHWQFCVLTEVLDFTLACLCNQP